jgi:hypothetical protein
MLSRSVGGVDFARQLAESRSSTSQPAKKFRSSAAPKGTKLPGTYVDRAKLRQDETADEKAERVQALEEMMKLQQIDEATFIKLRDEILGGDVASTHLVKGLDWRLLERVKRGEDVLSNDKQSEEENEVDKDAEGKIDDEFERLEDREVKAVDKIKTAKKGEMAPPSLIPGKKRNRDQILAEMKAARKAAQEAKVPSLGSKFKKVGESRAESRIERDEKGREVLITVDEHGNEKRKVRKVQAEPEEEKGHGLPMPDKATKPLGMELPELPQVTEEEDDMDIFDGAGDDYDPLAGIGDDDDEEESDAEEKRTAKDHPEAELEEKQQPGSMPPPPQPKQPTAPRNYFGDSTTATEIETPKSFSSDPTVLAAIKKASMLSPFAKENETTEDAATQARLKKLTQQDDRDAQDIDMGFGSSRFEDEEDFEEKKVKLSAWGGKDDDEDNGARGDGKGKRKRGPKKRKGDANNAEDVMKVIEGRKAMGS